MKPQTVIMDLRVKLPPAQYVICGMNEWQTVYQKRQSKLAIFALIAQLVERRTVNADAVGSSPTRSASYMRAWRNRQTPWT